MNFKVGEKVKVKGLYDHVICEIRSIYKIDKDNYCVELLIVNGDSGMYEDVILNVDMYNEKTINNSIKEIIAILNLSNKEIVEKYLNE